MINKNEKVSNLLVILVVIFVSCLMISNILANYMISIFGYSFDGGTLLFPVTYILSDLFSEVYGYRWSRRVTWLAASMNTLFAVLVILVTKIPSPVWFDGSHFAIALCSSFRIVVASIISYCLGDWVNDIIFEHLKKNNPNFNLFKVRAILSSVGGSLIDTTTFVLIAFLFTMPINEMPAMIILSVISKILYELIVLPVTCKITNIVRHKESAGEL